MSRTVFTVIALSSALRVGAARAEPVIYQFNENYEEGTHYLVHAGPWIEIIQAIPGETFDFYCCQEGGTVPADLQAITVDEDLGEVRVKVTEHFGWPYGADHVGQITLSAEGTTGSLEDIPIAGASATVTSDLLPGHACPASGGGAIPTSATGAPTGEAAAWASECPLPRTLQCAACASFALTGCRRGVSHASVVFSDVCPRVGTLPSGAVLVRI